MATHTAQNNWSLSHRIYYIRHKGFLQIETGSVPTSKLVLFCHWGKITTQLFLTMKKEKQVRAKTQKLKEQMWQRCGCIIKLLRPAMLPPTHLCFRACWGFLYPIGWNDPVNGDNYFAEMSTIASSHLCCVRASLTLFSIRWKCSFILFNLGNLPLTQYKWWCMTSKVRSQ